jgi:hypothetical protein
MGEKVQLKGDIYEVNFVYNVKMDGYANSSSDIPMLDEIVVLQQVIEFIKTGEENA